MKRPLNWPTHWSLATRVALASVALLVVLLVIVVTNFQQANDERRTAEVNNAYDTAQAVAGIVDGFASDLETAMLATALQFSDRPGPVDQSIAGANLHLLLQEYGFLRAIFVTDATGRVIATDSGVGIGVNLASRPYMQTLVGGAREVWSPGVAGLESGEVTATYGRTMIAPSGGVRGYLIAAFYPPRLAERLAGRIPVDANVILMDQRGFVLYSAQHASLTPQQRDLSALPAVRSALAGDSVRLDDVSGLLGTENRFGAIVPIRSTGWAVAFSRPTAPLDALLRDRLINQIIQVTVAVFLVAALMTLATRRITRPLAELARGAEGVARGDRSPMAAQGGGPEVARLSGAMQAMSAAVAVREDAIRLESDRRKKLADASRAFTEVVADMDAETATIARRVAEAVGDGCVVMLLSADEQFLTTGAVYHPDPQRLEFARILVAEPVLITGSIVERLVREAEPLFLPQAMPLLRDSIGPDLIGHIEGLGPQSLACVPLRAQGRVIGILGVWRDSAEAYQPEDVALLQEIGDRAALALENARLFIEVAARATEVERAMLAQDDFLSLISHDLRNPMTTIKAAAQLLQRRVASGTAKSDDLLSTVQVIDSAIAKVTRELDGILDLSLARAGRSLGLQLDRVDLVPMLRQTTAEYAHGGTHRVTIEVDDASLEGEWDEARLDRAFDNLVSNAVKFSPYGGTVTIAVRSDLVGDTRWATVSVRDEGIGIPAAEVGRVFERFYRGSTATKRQISGTGLGLSAVSLIVTAHGGTIEVTSAEGSGSTFTIRLPCRPPE